MNLGDCDRMGHPDQLISLQPAFDAEPVLGGHVVVAQDADLSYWTGPAARRTAAVDRMRRVTAGAPGVLSVRTPQQLRLGGNAGGYDWRGLL